MLSSKKQYSPYTAMFWSGFMKGLLSVLLGISSTNCSWYHYVKPSPKPMEIPPALMSEIDSLRKHYDVPGASIAIMEDGKITNLELGFANLEKAILVKKDTMFQVASITKALTSAVTLKLIDKKHISLDSSVNRWLKRWKIPGQNGDRVTIRMLLNHTGGFSNPYPDYGNTTISLKKATLVQHFLGLPPAINPPLTLVEVPGEKYRYCNGCYSVLQMFIEDVAQNDYRNQTKNVILKPLGMTHSSFDDSLLDKPKPNIAINYDDEKKPYPKLRKMPIYATGLLWSTSYDLALFMTDVQKGLQGHSKILSEEQAKLLVEPSSTPTRSLGFFIGDKFGNEKKNGKYFFHAGQNVGYLSLAIASLDGREGAVILINISSPWNSQDFPHFRFIKASLKAIAKHYHWE